MLQRGAYVICKVENDTSVESLTPPILKSIARTATLFTDEFCGYDLLWKLYTTKMIDHGKGLYVIGDAHTNSIEGFWRKFCKRVANAIYNWVSRKKVRFDMEIATTNIRVTLGKRSPRKEGQRIYGNIGSAHRDVEKNYGSVSGFRKGYNRCGALQSEKEEVIIFYPFS